MVRLWDEASLSRSVGDRLQQELTAHHMTKKRFAELAYVDPKTVSRWAQGKNITFSTLVAMANAFQISIADIFREEDVLPLYRTKYDLLKSRVGHNVSHTAFLFLLYWNQCENYGFERKER